MGHKGWIVCSGLLWMAMGLWLTWKGVVYFTQGILLAEESSSSLVEQAQNGTYLLLGTGLLIGFIKGRFILSKTVRRVCLRIVNLPLPIRFNQVYGASYLLLIAGMMLLGMVIRFAPMPVEVKGVIDVAVGSALFHGSMFYFRAARSIRPAV